MQNAARDGFLDEAIFRRANISLAMLAGTNLFFIASTFIPNPIYPSSPLLPMAALALGAINVNQLWVSGINFVKYSPEGFNTLKIFKVSYVKLSHTCCQCQCLQIAHVLEVADAMFAVYCWSATWQGQTNACVFIVFLMLVVPYYVEASECFRSDFLLHVLTWPAVSIGSNC